MSGAAAAPRRVRVQDILKTILYDLRVLKEDLQPVVPDFKPDSNNYLREFSHELDRQIYFFDRFIRERDEKEKTK